MPHFSYPLVFLSILAAAACSAALLPPLNDAEQQAVYRILESVNPDINWRTLFPDDLCSAAPHGVVCDYFFDGAATPHITELSFGYVSDYSSNPPCNSHSTLDPFLLAPLSHLKKLFFYKCFTHQNLQFPDFSPLSSSLEEVVFIENPALVGSLEGKISKLRRLKRFHLTGNSVSGGLPIEFHHLSNLEDLTLSGNMFKGEISVDIFLKMKKLKILDLSHNKFEGNVPESIGHSSELLKVDLSYNGFSGRIPETFSGLKSIEFLDLSYNHFGNFGLPLVLGEMSSLKEVYLNGNFLGGEIPDIWRNLGGIMGLGLSGTGLVGNIPKSMGVHLRNVCFIGLDNNMLEGVVPREFGELELMSELNLQNNNLSGRVPFSESFVSKLGEKLKLGGNLDLCVDEDLKSVSLGLKVCKKPHVSKTTLLSDSSSPRVHVCYLVFVAVGILFWL